MSYVFTIRTQTKKQLLADVSAKLAEAVAALPHQKPIQKHVTDVVAALVATIHDDPAKDYVATINADLAEDAGGKVFAASIGVSIDQAARAG